MSFDFEKYADSMVGDLEGNCNGYSFVISYKQEAKIKRSGGEARRKSDPLPRPMGPDEIFNMASISKSISAAALLKLLFERTDVSLDSPILGFLPDHWQVHASMVGITFRQILSHSSGIRFGGGVSYRALKENFEEGINTADIGQREYNNSNYGIMRLLIPALANDKIPQNENDKAEPIIDMIQESFYAKRYMDYVQKNLFDKAGLPTLGCKPVPLVGGLCYQFPKMTQNGESFSDMTLTNASRGWVMSVAQMARFFRALHYTESIIPKALSDRMKNQLLGYDQNGTTAEGIDYVWKNGSYPGSKNAGELNALIVIYKNDVQVAMVINSQLGGGKSMSQIIHDAFDEAYIMKKVQVKTMKKNP
jgi:CubicO group peptidase (beta-lactamase class C family)